MSYMKEFMVILPNLATMFVFGFGRLLLVKKLDYQGHVSEYGVHWNFYTTIFFTTLASMLIRDSKWALVQAFALMLAYDLCFA